MRKITIAVFILFLIIGAIFSACTNKQKQENIKPEDGMEVQGKGEEVAGKKEEILEGGATEFDFDVNNWKSFVCNNFSIKYPEGFYASQEGEVFANYNSIEGFTKGSPANLAVFYISKERKEKNKDFEEYKSRIEKFANTKEEIKISDHYVIKIYEFTEGYDQEDALDMIIPSLYALVELEEHYYWFSHLVEGQEHLTSHKILKQALNTFKLIH